MYGWTAIRTDTTLIAISPKPFGQGIKKLLKILEQTQCFYPVSKEILYLQNAVIVYGFTKDN